MSHSLLPCRDSARSHKQWSQADSSLPAATCNSQDTPEAVHYGARLVWLHFLPPCTAPRTWPATSGLSLPYAMSAPRGRHLLMPLPLPATVAGHHEPEPAPLLPGRLQCMEQWAERAGDAQVPLLGTDRRSNGSSQLANLAPWPTRLDHGGAAHSC